MTFSQVELQVQTIKSKIKIAASYPLFMHTHTLKNYAYIIYTCIYVDTTRTKLSVKLAESEERAVTGSTWWRLKSRGKIKCFDMESKEQELTDGKSLDI